MSNYKYSSEYEREETQKYEGTYTPEQIELNKKLYEVVSKEHIDFYEAEELLKTRCRSTWWNRSVWVGIVRPYLWRYCRWFSGLQ